MPAAEIETAVLNAVREHLGTIDIAEDQVPADDRDLIERHVERVIIKREMIEIELGDPLGNFSKKACP